MKKILLLIAAPFVFLLALSAQTTQPEADGIALERLNQETRPYTLYAKEDVQQKMTITTDNEEILELDYACWVYYVHYVNNTGKYLFVKASNGNVLEVNMNGDAMPEDLAEWRIVTLGISQSMWKYTDECIIIELIFYSSENKVQIKSTSEKPVECPRYALGHNVVTKYHMEGNKMYFPDRDGNFYGPPFNAQGSWIISLSENEMEMDVVHGGVAPQNANIVNSYRFIRQTN